KCFFMLFREIPEGYVRVDPQRGYRPIVLGRERDRAPPAPRSDRPLTERSPRIRHDALRIDPRSHANAITRRAGAVRPVEGENARLDGRERDATSNASEPLAHPNRLGPLAFGGRIREQPALAELERELDRVGQPALDPILHHDPIDHHIEVMPA